MIKAVAHNLCWVEAKHAGLKLCALAPAIDSSQLFSSLAVHLHAASASYVIDTTHMAHGETGYCQADIAIVNGANMQDSTGSPLSFTVSQMDRGAGARLPLASCTSKP